MKMPILPQEYYSLTEELKRCQRDKISLGKKLGEVMSTSGSFASKTPGYTETENALGVINSKIGQILSILHETDLIKTVGDLSSEKIGVYSRVIVEDQNGDEKKYYICHLPNICQINGYLAVSPRSPVGQVLMGRMDGETVELLLPKGKIALTIIHHGYIE